MNKHYSKNKHCLCGKLISNYAKQCGSCRSRIRKGKLNSNWKNNSSIKHCKCGSKISFYSKQCWKCFLRGYKGKNHHRFGKINHSKWEKYGKIFMRSSWEIAYAKYLDKKGIKWLYEPKTFNLGEMTYTPDFYLPEKDLYIEIKGYWRADAKVKFKLFKKQYTNFKIKVLNKNKLKQLKII